MRGWVGGQAPRARGGVIAEHFRNHPVHHLMQDDCENQRQRPNRNLGYEFGQVIQEWRLLSYGLLAPAGTRMKSAMDLAQVALRQMSIYLRGRNIAVAEHLLHRAQIGAAFQQMGCEAVPQRMRTDPRQSWIERGPSFEVFKKPLPRHRSAQPA